MGQLTKLWSDDMKGGLPVIFNDLQQPVRHGWPDPRRDHGATTFPARMGAGFNPNQMHAERVDGFNPLAVIEAYGRKKKMLLKRARARCCSTS